MRTSENAEEENFARAPVLGCKNSLVVARLRVASACYITVQRTLLDRRVSTLKGLRLAAEGC
jgi:hypothetical protein